MKKKSFQICQYSMMNWRKVPNKREDPDPKEILVKSPLNIFLLSVGVSEPGNDFKFEYIRLLWAKFDVKN